jgi:outer membrane protein insertion porin family
MVNTRTFDEVIRRELMIAEGDAVNDLIIQQSFTNLKSLNIFESIDIIEKKITDTTTDIEINVGEKPTGSFQVGLSIGSLDGYSFVLGLNEKNIGGTGRNLSTRINSSSKNTEYSLNILEPHIYNKKIDLLYGIGYVEKDLLSKSSYKLDTLQSNIGLQYNLTKDFFHRISLNYIINKYTVNDISKVTTSIANSQGSNAEIILNNNLTFNSLNSYMRPTKGLYSKFTNIISPVTNSDNGYIKNILLLRKYYLINKTTYSAQSTLGNVFSLQNTNIDNDNKFSLGGRWLRGFDSLGAGPRKSRSAYIGGNNIFVTKFDLSRPLFSNHSDNPIDINLFTDVGSVFGNKDAPEFSKETIRASYGVGFKFYTPIGPIGFSWSFPVKSETYDIKRSFLFSIGDLN